MSMSNEQFNRLIDEEKLLNEKIMRMVEFSESKKFSELNNLDQDLLIGQGAAMVAYHKFLMLRISLVRNSRTEARNQ